LVGPPQETITAEDTLHRRLVPNGHVAADGTTVLRSAFLLPKRLPGETERRPDPELSVELERFATPEETATRDGRPGFGTAAFPASEPIAMNLTVRHAPLDGNYAHSHVLGLTKREECQRLADVCRVVVPTNPRPRAGGF
jgi:hypothetical protein